MSEKTWKKLSGTQKRIMKDAREKLCSRLLDNWTISKRKFLETTRKRKTADESFKEVVMGAQECRREGITEAETNDTCIRNK